VFGEHRRICCPLDGERCLAYQARSPRGAPSAGLP
jgi:hypothetical protein